MAWEKPPPEEWEEGTQRRRRQAKGGKKRRAVPRDAAPAPHRPRAAPRRFVPFKPRVATVDAKGYDRQG